MNTNNSSSKIVTDVSKKLFAPLDPKTTKVCAYVRISTNNPAQKSSFQNQIYYYKNKLSNLSNATFIGIFSDDGISGSKESRPGFDAMLEKARSGEIDLIYTKSVSRFARNTLLLLETIRELRSLDVRVIFEKESIDTMSSDGELMLSILASIAEEERKSVRSNVRWAINKNYLRGNPMINARQLLGYDKDKVGNLVINPDQAQVVRKVFQLYLEGIGAYKAAQILRDDNTPTYTKGLWNDERVRRIISNEKYTGSCLMQKSFVNDSGKQVRNRGERDKYLIEDAHPAIITKEDWDKAQSIRKSRKKKTYPYSSLLHCEYCGSTLIRTANQLPWVSWVCYKYLRDGKDSCPGSRIREKRIIELTKDNPITEPVIVKEVNNGSEPQKIRQKNYRFIPISDNTPDE